MGNNKYPSKRHLNQKRKRAQTTWLFLTLGGISLIVIAFLFIRGNQNSQTLAAIEVNGAPSLRVDREQVDLGNVQLGQTVEVSFQVTNVGDQPLRFSEQPYIEVLEGC
jgi:hypothetical protein